MRKLLLIYLLVFGYILSPAQEELSNIPTVDSIMIESIENVPDTLYEGHNYEYYQKLYKSSSFKKTMSLVLIPIGAGLGVWGVYQMRNSIRENESSENYKAFRGGLALLFGGALLFTGGIVVSISSGKNKRISKKAIEELKGNTALSFVVSKNGVGLILRF